MNARPWSRIQADLLTGLAVVLPAVLSVVLVVWLFGTVSNLTDVLLFFLPKKLTHSAGGTGPVYWYWSLVSFLVAVALLCLLGRLTRNFAGRKMIQLFDFMMLNVPLLNKIYSAIKQVNAAFTSGNKSSFKQVVLVQFPRPGVYSIGFITSEHHPEADARTGLKLVSVFIPTTPNPTSGFLILVPETELTKLDMSVADGIKLTISLGAVTPDFESVNSK